MYILYNEMHKNRCDEMRCHIITDKKTGLSLYICYNYMCPAHFFTRVFLFNVLLAQKRSFQEITSTGIYPLFQND